MKPHEFPALDFGELYDLSVIQQERHQPKGSVAQAVDEVIRRAEARDADGG